ncbi:restriction endonuclease subunit S [Gardnerella piotii]|uniref:Restriction endonuclease subunit S n=1 Tax=Gardnerella piotii TaxID=2792977 RepID=A0ABU5MQD7_9BIFI|nr:restriction endonuclease subunit S [Gardnerella piotii]MDZ7544633.1 restriction endonuclease subunit S [Gardnerella piotii]MDZ7552002.1 restriction endonuclease subunit S [Gardnerella piotii]
MSKLDELIQELCPNGVEYKVLGELCNICTGKLNANAKDEDGIYPFFTCDANPYKINEYAFDTSAILISGNGSQVGHLNQYEGKFNAYQRTYVLDNFKLVIKPFLFHFMDAYLKPYIMVNCKKGSVPYITLPMLQSFKVPVPPLEVQREIVHILDSFTLLTAELTAELTARKKQYEYYRDTLLTFNDNNPLHSLISRYCPNGVEYKKIGDIAFISTGSKLRDIQESHSLYEYINAGTTNSGYSLDWNCDGDVVTTPSRGQGGIGYVGYQKNKFWLGPLCYKIVGNADFVLNKYLYYYLSNNSYEILSLKKDGGVPAINKSDLEELILSVPPLEVQRQIVQILDRFDTICSDLNIGLPAEIEARQKQYEFYRDKLLSFKQL